MGAADEQKRYEWHILKHFLEAAQISAQVVESREAPDFIVSVNGQQVGVEITLLFISHDTKGSLPQAGESIAARIVSSAQELYLASGATPAQVFVRFDSRADLRRVNRDRAAQDLASLVQGFRLLAGQKQEWRPDRRHGPLSLRTISCVDAYGLLSFEMTDWVLIGVGPVAPLSAASLQSRIDEKAKLLPKYKRVVEANWLLIVADAGRLSQMIEARADFAPGGVSSPFCRTFFYRYPGSTVIELGHNSVIS